LLIAQISDTHLLPPTSDQPAASLRADCLRRCVADINQQNPDAVVFTGDTVQHGQPDEYALLLELLAPLQAPLYLVPGNRDNKDALRAAFNDHPRLPKNGEFLHYVVDGASNRIGRHSCSSTTRLSMWATIMSAAIAGLTRRRHLPTSSVVTHKWRECSVATFTGR
jgi:predicted MPP superfamily phosphohydrolase